eukprot:IDg905t1
MSATIVPVYRRISVQQLLCTDDEIQCTQVNTDIELIDAIVSSGSPCDGDPGIGNDGVLEHEEETHYLGSLKQQLATIAAMKHIVLVREGQESALFRGLRNLQSSVRAEKNEGLRQTHIGEFF